MDTSSTSFNVREVWSNRVSPYLEKDMGKSFGPFGGNQVPKGPGEVPLDDLSISGVWGVSRLKEMGLVPT
jgi:hypothetical protein